MAFALWCAVSLNACASRSVARYDKIDAVKVEQMAGNTLPHGLISKSVLCLNARREIYQSGRTDHYLYTELATTTDFSLAPGESLVLLTDGERHAFAPTNSQTVFVGRRGFASTLYPVPVDIFVKIVNSRETKVRLKGTGAVLDQELSSANRQRFREYLLRYFSKPPMAAWPAASPAREPLSDDAARHIDTLQQREKKASNSPPTTTAQPQQLKTNHDAPH